MTDTILIHCDAVRDSFRQWHAEQEPLDAQLSESLAALAAYQSHLDDWQRQLAEERNELRAAREQLEQVQSATQVNEVRLAEVTEELASAREEIAILSQNLLASADELLAERQKTEHKESSADDTRMVELTVELNAAREKISSLTTMLLSRTEELRTLDVRRAEAGAELDLARARERELVAALEELRQMREWEHEQWADESRQLREMVERRTEDVDPDYGADRANNSPTEARRESKREERAGENPVLASVKEQFGKLRQQRAMDRPASKKTR